MTSHLETVRQKIIEAVPSILDFGFGCVISSKDGCDNYDAPEYKNLTVINRQNDYFWCFKEHYNNIQVGMESILKEFEILGRPIRLSDVLLAISLVSMPKHFLILPSGNIYLFEQGLLGMPVAYWDMYENLDGQSEDTLTFLAKLLT